MQALFDCPQWIGHVARFTRLVFPSPDPPALALLVDYTSPETAWRSAHWLGHIRDTDATRQINAIDFNRLQHDLRIRNPMTATPKAPIMPVLGDGSGCLGHILFSARGYRAFDRHDRELGMFVSAGEAAAAILTAPSS